MTELAPWLATIGSSAEVDGLARALRASEHKRVAVRGCRGSLPTVLAGLVNRACGVPVLLVVAHLDEADDAVDDLEGLAAHGLLVDVRRFGALEVLPGESGINLELVGERLGLVRRLGEGDVPGVIVAPIQALMQPVPEPERLGRFFQRVGVGDQRDPVSLAEWLTGAGYTRVEAIEQPGDFAVRGGILDLYAASASAVDEAGNEVVVSGVRLDFFGDEIESIRQIDLDTMASGRGLKSVEWLGTSVDALVADEGTTTLMGLLPEATRVLMHEPMELSEQARGYYERLHDPRGIVAPVTVMGRLGRFGLCELADYSSPTPGAEVIELPSEVLPSFDTDARRAVDELTSLGQEAGREVVVLCRREAEAQRLGELLGELEESGPPPAIELGTVHRGFVWRSGECALTVVPHHELFHRYETRRRVRKIATEAGGEASDAFLDLEVGDYVVHVDHGIAKFTGIRSMRRSGMTQEFLTLEFAEKALLHVPATQIELVQKYIGGFSGRPPLSKLGGKRWSKQKDQVREAVKDLAAELLRVQAARATQPGIRYPGDTVWQREFEAEFPYEETEDQLSAIAAIKKDMGGDQPMDRLLCGDVGFGKTEVAIRAAFKAAEYGKQVAILVPTTVLAEQHHRTFMQRMADYPFKVACISRFRTGLEQRKVLKELEAGRLDVLIGTHRLLSEDVKFADLGLVVIDEEQRFGVEHKNKLLSFRMTADVLTMTATPIPRTLHMSMVGLRDISSLTTAPVDRRAVVTEVVPYDRNRVKQALVRELNREGQAYFVHNRVHNILSVADDIQRLVPDARVIVGHGQMPAAELQSVMLRFMRREADVLVSTTIIESGIDIPTANTMFINEADHFGLADLHQLRGRVGRGKHRGYCYLLLPEDRPVNDVAAKRLRAIEQYSMLGAGFRIAMRDLEIRGAGNLLGAEQSGHIAAVGYEMYCVLLEQETKRLRHETVVEAVRTHLELPVAGHLPKRWIGSDKHRMETYRRLSRADDLEAFDKVERALVEAYGDPPEQASRLLELAELRVAASRHGCRRIKLEEKDLIFTSDKAEELRGLFEEAPGRVSLVDDQTLYYRPPESYVSEPGTLLAVLRKLLVRPFREGVKVGPLAL
ncbi:transcription-repair coupling factor [Mucisphaera calidilacus]|uniref:Transcription-repair-coupling factor n=1 Tax=Mucisphaera calidilacus TaxID=2527982 RepID=A0A518BW51_9BACT|nr:transcription-repair coupling factor [Mucisphaera calidilacus]QDU71206.1 Transcription-repair-coupling factor [Mucisphaera calidilacus]